MEGNLILLDYDSRKCDTGIPLADIQSIVITVISGDEIAIVTKKTGEVETIDSITINDGFRNHDSKNGQNAKIHMIGKCLVIWRMK